MDWSFLYETSVSLIAAAPLTIELTVVSVIFGTALAMALALCRCQGILTWNGPPEHTSLSSVVLLSSLNSSWSIMGLVNSLLSVTACFGHCSGTRTGVLSLHCR